jgi:zinc transport system substrate-binding protein
MRIAMKRLLFACCALYLASGLARAEPPEVVASIKPVHAIASAVMEGVAQPKLLLDAGLSEHTAQLRPSQLEMLQKADLVLVVGAGLEAFLDHALEHPDLAEKPRLILAEVPGLELLPMREGGGWEVHLHEAGHAHDEESADHEGPDPHVWLDPRNAKRMGAALADRLGALDPSHADIYEANAARFGEAMDRLESELSASLAQVRDRPYIVFHDGYQYFEHRFGLTALGSIALAPEIAPGAKRLSDIRQRIREAKAVCVFGEPQFDTRYVTTVLEGTAARPGTLDGLGANLPTGPHAYEELLRRLARDLSNCLQG